MERVVAFLRELYKNNNTEWFHAHRKDYEEARDRFLHFAQRLIDEMGKVDESVKGLALKDCTYRINRDIRFSSDKSPYKTHFGVFLAPGGKKSGHAGYYFHLSVGGDCYPDANMVAVGHYCYDKKVVEIVREDIMDEGDKFDAMVKKGGQDGLSLDRDDALKKVPKQYAECAYPDYILLKSYCMSRMLDFSSVPDEESLLTYLLEVFGRNRLFVQYLNQVIDYTKEEL